MNQKEFDATRNTLNDMCEALLFSKGRDYTDGNDRLSNFKELGRELGMSPMVPWYVYFRKHISAIATRIRTGRVESEPIEGRFADARNYLDLGYALMAEMEGEERTKAEKLIRSAMDSLQEAIPDATGCAR